MFKVFVYIVIAVALLVMIVGIIALSSVPGVWNKFNTNLQTADAGKSLYSAALNTCTEKIKGVWASANQYMDHESNTFKGVAEARSGYEAAADAFKKAAEEGKGTKELTQAGAGVVQAALAFRIQIEAYPNLRAVEAVQENMRNMEASTNEIKTALDDWITAIKDYNKYRGSFWPSIVGIFITKFPSKLDYYEGEVKKLDMDKLNPANK